MVRCILFFSILVGMAACTQIEQITQEIAPKSPWERYARSLRKANLDGTPMGKQWFAAAETTFKDSIWIESPFRETGYFTATNILANSYQLSLKAGELLTVELLTKPAQHTIFADLFRWETNNQQWKTVASLDSAAQLLQFETTQQDTLLLRIQPELLVDVKYVLTITIQPTYTFPVQGKGNRDVWSVWGDPRDGGRRRHEGIDIFAPRGTPVLATTDGRVRSVRNRGLGGKQVWLSDRKREQSIYYAHLDSQLVREDQMVKAGDTVGLIGNTGNARNTRPHLHLGIYKRGRGAIDPFPFVSITDTTIIEPFVDTSFYGQLARIRTNRATLTDKVGRGSQQVAALSRHTPLQVIGASKTYYRVQLPFGKTGYVSKNEITALDQPIQNYILQKSLELQARAIAPAAPIARVDSSQNLAVLGQLDTLLLVRTANGQQGWLAQNLLSD